MGCRGVADQAALRRYALDARGAVVRDDARRLASRGAYLHDDPGCLARATARRAWNRAFRRGVTDLPTS